MSRFVWALLGLAALLLVPALLIGGFNGVSLVGVLAAATAVVLIVRGTAGDWVGDAPADEPLPRLDELERKGR